jgi:hypothetical protein
MLYCAVEPFCGAATNFETSAVTFISAVMPPYPQVIQSKTYSGYMKPRIIPNAIHNVIFV